MRRLKCGNILTNIGQFDRTNAFWLEIGDLVCAHVCIGFNRVLRDKKIKTLEYYLSLQSRNRHNCVSLKCLTGFFGFFLCVRLCYHFGFHVGTSLNLLLLLHLGQDLVAGLLLLPLQLVHLHRLLVHFAGPVSIHFLVLEICIVKEPEMSNMFIIVIIFITFTLQRGQRSYCQWTWAKHSNHHNHNHRNHNHDNDDRSNLAKRTK